MEFIDLSDQNFLYDSQQYMGNSNADIFKHQYSSTKSSNQGAYEGQGCFESSSSDSNEKMDKNQSITNKKIQKKEKYEPIVDNSVVYRYEDNPVEYKRIRKKQQNRESATRVRYKQKSHTGQIENEIKHLKEQNTQLQLINAKLQAENNSLSNQVSFFQRLIQKDFTSYDVDPQQPQFEMERVTSQKSHFVFLTIMTAVVCMIFASSESDQSGNVFESIVIALQKNDTLVPLKKEVDLIIWNNSVVRNLKVTLHWVIGLTYCAYLIYFLYSVYFKKFFRHKLKNL